MESSPLKYLDYDVSQILCEQVRLSREEEARRFHDNLFHYGEKMNRLSHNLIVRIYVDGFFGKYPKYITAQVARIFPITDPQWSHILRLCIKNNECRYKGQTYNGGIPTGEYAWEIQNAILRESA